MANQRRSGFSFRHGQGFTVSESPWDCHGPTHGVEHAVPSATLHERTDVRVCGLGRNLGVDSGRSQPNPPSPTGIPRLKIYGCSLRSTNRFPFYERISGNQESSHRHNREAVEDALASRKGRRKPNANGNYISGAFRHLSSAPDHTDPSK